jgi:excisionase family DNA binding protein
MRFGLSTAQADTQTESIGMETAELHQLVSRTQVAEMLNVSRHTIPALVRRGKLHPVRICRRLLFDIADVLKLVEEAKKEGLIEGRVPGEQPPGAIDCTRTKNPS